MNYCPIIKSKALKKGIKQGQISSFPSLFNSRPSSLKPRGMDVVSYVLTKASSCPLVDTATVRTQHPVSHRRPAIRREASLAVLAIHPATFWLIGPLALHRHYCPIIMIHSANGSQDFKGKEGGRVGDGRRGGPAGGEKVAKSAITLHFQGGKKSHHWLNHLYNIRWFQQFHLMRKSTLSL